jgi:hypothetical protein
VLAAADRPGLAGRGKMRVMATSPVLNRVWVIRASTAAERQRIQLTSLLLAVEARCEETESSHEDAPVPAVRDGADQTACATIPHSSARNTQAGEAMPAAFLAPMLNGRASPPRDGGSRNAVDDAHARAVCGCRCEG